MCVYFITNTLLIYLQIHTMKYIFYCLNIFVKLHTFLAAVTVYTDLINNLQGSVNSKIFRMRQIS